MIKTVLVSFFFFFAFHVQKWASAGKDFLQSNTVGIYLYRTKAGSAKVGHLMRHTNTTSTISTFP